MLAGAEPPIRDVSFTTTSFSLEAGLPSNVSQAVAQTADGYLWVGTEAGLARFDGVRFRVFRTSEHPELGDNLIRCLLEDREGWLWIGTNKGACRYRDGKFERIGDIGAPVGTITQDSDGSLWLGTQGAGLWEFRAGALTQRADGKLMKPTDSPLRVFADSTGRIWAAIDRGNLVWVENGVIKPADPQLAGVRQTNRMVESPRGTIWLSAQHELFRWRDGALTKVGSTLQNGDEQITGVSVDRAGRLWVCAGRTLWVADNPETDSFVRVPVPAAEYPRQLFQDREGTYWIATSGDGLARMRTTPFRMANAVDHVPLQRARSVTVDADGHTWAALGAETHGLVRIAPDGTIGFVSIGGDNDADTDVQCVCASSDGGVWLGTRGSLAYWKDGQVRRFADQRNVRVIYSSRDGTMWFGPLARGVAYRKEERFVPVEVPTSRAKATVSAISDGPDGAVYVGFLSEGILRLAPDGSVSDISRGMPSQEIRAIHFDAENRLWVGFRRKGLGVQLDGVWRNPTEFVLPFGERVTAIDEDGLGNMWLGTARGIIWGRRDDFLSIARGAPAEGRFRVAGVAEGVGGGNVGTGTQPTMWNADGVLWYATRSGVVSVRPGTAPLNLVPPPVRIESVTIDGRLAYPGPELRLPAGVRSLSIDYTALAFVQPERVLFRYRLGGHEADWVQAGTRRTAFFTRLEPGRHEFNVIACNEDGVWNSTGASLTIIQQPWFYQTWWFYLLVAVCVVSLGLALFAWRTAGLRRLVSRQTEQIRRQLDKESQLRAELERKARLESLGVLAGGIAHDFNNLLTVIMANVELASLNERVRAVAGTQLAAAARGAQRAAELTQQLLTFAKGGDPVCRAVSLADVVREAAEFARHGTLVRCDIVVEPDLPPANADRAQISRVVHNLVLNATQAMPNGGVIRIKLASEEVKDADSKAMAPGWYVKLSIADEGSGIAPEHLPHVFDPYFSTKPKNHGLGLATVHSIVKRHQGHVNVESRLGHGATFHVWLPVATGPVHEDSPAVEKVMEPRASKRVLFMDDEEIIRTVAGGILRHLGHDPVLVADGNDAVREFGAAMKAGRPFDAVVLDLTVPGGMGGTATLEQLKEIDPDVRAIVSSGYSSDPVLANFRQYGFAAVVPKPYQLEELAHAILEVTSHRTLP